MIHVGILWPLQCLCSQKTVRFNISALIGYSRTVQQTTISSLALVHGTVSFSVSIFRLCIVMENAQVLLINYKREICGYFQSL